MGIKIMIALGLSFISALLLLNPGWKRPLPTVPVGNSCSMIIRASFRFLGGNGAPPPPVEPGGP